MSFSDVSYFGNTVYDFKSNPYHPDKAYIGRLLFYDTRLSANHSISCASCHSPYNAFAHVDHKLSHGINDRIGKRNAPSLMNLAWQSSFMWDGAIQQLDMQALAPISHPDEMGSNLNQVIQYVRTSDSYQKAFKKAFGDTAVTGQRILQCFSQFLVTLVSNQSLYDSVKRGEAVFSEQQQRGYALFQQHCNSCHTEPLFTNGQFAANGLKPDSLLNDLGRYSITQNPEDSLLFKVPTLRNIEFTYPYMHDGRYRYLPEVIQHYTHLSNSEGKLSGSLKTHISLSAEQKTDLMAFLLTLSDRHFLFNTKYQFPKELLTSINYKNQIQ